MQYKIENYDTDPFVQLESLLEQKLLLESVDIMCLSYLHRNATGQPDGEPCTELLWSRLLIPLDILKKKLSHRLQ